MTDNVRSPDDLNEILHRARRSVDPGTFVLLSDGIDALARRNRDLEARARSAEQECSRLRGIRLESPPQERYLLETITESTDIHLAYLDREFRFVRVNRAYAAGSGHPWHELVGKNHFDLFPNAENQAIFERVRDTGEPFRAYAKPFAYRDQPERGVTYWDWSLMPVRDGSGAIAGLVLSLTDVTDRVTARTALCESERNYRLLTGQMPEMFILCEIVRDDDGTPIGYRYLEMNEPAERALGRAARELVGKDLLEEFSPVSDLARGLLDRVAVTGEPGQAEEYVPVRGRYFAVLVYRPQENRIALIASDITAKKNLEEQLAFHASLFDRVNDAIIATDERRIITAWNRTAGVLYGITAEEAIGRPVADVVGTELGSGRGDRMPEGSPREAVHYHAGGMPILVEESSTPIHADDGAFVGFVSVVRDITDRKMAESALKESERRFRQIFDESPSGICYHALDGRLVAANAACLEIFAAPSQEALGWLNLLEFPSFPEDLRKRIRRGEQVRATVTLDLGRVQRLYGIAPTEPGTISVELFGSPVVDPKTGAFRGYLLQLTDVTSRILMETIKRDAYRQIERNMEQFAILGDHIRHPLQVVVARADLLDDEATAASIREQVWRINTIIKQLDEGWVESRAIREFLQRNELS